MSKLQELVGYIEKQYAAPNQHGVVARIIDKAHALLAEEQSQLKHTTQAAVESWKAIAEQSQKPPAPAGLVERVKAIRTILNKHLGPTYATLGIAKEIEEAISRPQPAEVEPLAVTAKKMGFWKVTILDGIDSMANGFVSIELEREKFDITETPKRCEMFVDKTYAAAEAKARAYLEGLPDVNKENV